MTPAVAALTLTALGASMSNDAYRREVDAWAARRIARLTAPDGWLSLAGLFWLEEGDNRIGSAPDNDVVFPAKAPAHLGALVRHGRTVELRPAAGAGITDAAGRPLGVTTLASDKGGEATKLRVGSLVFFVIERAERIGVRLRDEDSPARRSFTGIDRYPVSPTWRVEARLERYEPKRELPITSVIGTVEPQPSPGALVFVLGGVTYRLDAVEEEGTDELFVIFGDATNGHGTYGAGRFVYAPRPGPDGRTVLDFNEAYNPPCAFTPFATCPLPPPQNRLKLRVEAGEKTWGHH